MDYNKSNLTDEQLNLMSNEELKELMVNGVSVSLSKTLGVDSEDGIITEEGINHIYTGANSLSTEDMDSESNINIINLTNGTNHVYGSKAIDIVTSNEANKFQITY